jgi:hypothetical protein
MRACTIDIVQFNKIMFSRVSSISNQPNSLTSQLQKLHTHVDMQNKSLADINHRFATQEEETAEALAAAVVLEERRVIIIDSRQSSD